MKKLISITKKKIAIILYSSLFISLISSELINSFYNNRFDLKGMNSWARIVTSFKPTVLLLYVIFTTILMLIVFRFLSPLFNFFLTKFTRIEKKKEAYRKARKAVIGMPKMVIIFQTAIWLTGTTAYYAMKGWQAESGIPFVFGLSLKVTSGILGGLYAIFFINLLLMPIKRKLKIVDIKKGEIDQFARIKDFVAIICSSFYLIVQISYLTWYYAQSTVIPDLKTFSLPFLVVGAVLFILSIGPNILSRIEFRLQIREIIAEMGEINSGTGESQKEPIYLTGFDELGDLAAITNQVLVKFTKILDQINDTVSHLSVSSTNLLEDSQANAGTTVAQAAAVAEVVATMEDSNRLSRDMGALAEEVKQHSLENLNKVSMGISTLNQYLATMEQLKDSNKRSIDFVFSLNENIKTIMDVSTIIKSIADQIKIIAFNAELEAAAAGEAGKNFEIVASEVRRLADNTVNAATEIREKINFIEKESNHLYSASQETTQLIDSGWNLSKETESSFQIIQQTSTTTSQSAKTISSNLQIQISGFEQILITMKEISATSKDVSLRIKSSAKTAISLKDLIQALNDLAK